MAVALVEYQAGGLSFELGRKGTTLLGHQTPLYGEHSRPKWVSGISRPLQIISIPEGTSKATLENRLYIVTKTTSNCGQIIKFFAEEA